MIDAKLKKFIEGMPKIELHLHIEGTLEPELAFKLAERNGITLTKAGGEPYKDAAELRAAYEFGNLQQFLDLYYQGMNVLRTEQDFYDLTMDYLKKVASQNVTHTEIFFDPQGHTERGVSFDTAVSGIRRALDDGEKNLGVSSKLIMSFLRHLPEKADTPPESRPYKDAFETLDQARPYMKEGVIDGIGLDSSERGFPPSNFERVFAEAKARHPHLKLMAHAGEEGPAEYVHEALGKLKIDRVDHGNHSLDDPALVTQLAEKGMGLTVCPLSNLKLCHTLDFATDKKLSDMRDHTLKTMLGHGLKATVNSDDPAYFGGYMNENFIAVADALDLTRDDVVKLAQNAIDISFLTPDQKQQKTAELQEYVARAELADKYVNPDVGQVRRYG